MAKSSKAKIGASIVLDGEKEFKAAVTSCNKSLGTMKSELGLVKEKYAENANSLEALRAKHSVLSKILDEQKQKVEAVRVARDNAVQAQATGRVTGAESTLTTQGTQLSTIQGQISSKVWQADITSAVANLSVGGRNLLLKTDVNQYGMGNFVPFRSSGATVDSSTKYFDSVTIKAPGNGGIEYNSYINLKPNTEYTYSAVIKSAVSFSMRDRVPLYIWLVESEQVDYLGTVLKRSDTQIPADTWKRIYVIFKTPSSADVYYMKPSIYGFGSNNVLNVCQLKVEEGNKATDWSPAPEDGLVENIYLAGTTTIDGDRIDTGSLFARKITASNLNITGGDISIHAGYSADKAIGIKFQTDGYNYVSSGIGKNGISHESISGKASAYSKVTSSLRSGGLEIEKTIKESGSSGATQTTCTFKQSGTYGFSANCGINAGGNLYENGTALSNKYAKKAYTRIATVKGATGVPLSSEYTEFLVYAGEGSGTGFAWTFVFTRDSVIGTAKRLRNGGYKNSSENSNCVIVINSTCTSMCLEEATANGIDSRPTTNVMVFGR